LSQRHESRNTRKMLIRNRRFLLAILAGIVLPSIIAALFSVQLVFGTAIKVGTAQQVLPTEFYSQYGLGLLSAAIAVGGSCIGAGIAIYGAASAGAAAIAERPESSIWVLILAGLGKGVAIYGLLIAIIILSKLPAVA